MAGLGRRSAALLEPEAMSIGGGRKSEVEVEDMLWRGILENVIF